MFVRERYIHRVLCCVVRWFGGGGCCANTSKRARDVVYIFGVTLQGAVQVINMQQVALPEREYNIKVKETKSYSIA